MQRYGPAADSLPPLGAGKVNTTIDTTKGLKSVAPTTVEKKPEAEQAEKGVDANSGPGSPPKDFISNSAVFKAGDLPPKKSNQTAPSTEDPSKAMDTVLHMDAATTAKSDEHKPPHLQPPPYVHHFDTYSLVKDLEKGGFTPDQSVTLMKAVRGLLAQNLDVAKDGLVSKSDVENVRPLCSPFLSPDRTQY